MRCSLPIGAPSTHRLQSRLCPGAQGTAQNPRRRAASLPCWWDRSFSRPKESQPDVSDADERKRAAERTPLEAERQQAAEQARLEEERKQAAEQVQAEQEHRRAAEEARFEKERRKSAEQTRLEEELTKAEAKRALEEAETERLAREKAKAERIAEEKEEKEHRKRKRVEAQRLIEEKAEQQRLARQKAGAERVAAELEQINSQRINVEKVSKGQSFLATASQVVVMAVFVSLGIAAIHFLSFLPGWLLTLGMLILALTGFITGLWTAERLSRGRANDNGHQN
jgi:hypothetical protein